MYGILSRSDQVTCDALQARMQTIAVSPKSLGLKAVELLNRATNRSSARIFAM